MSTPSDSAILRTIDDILVFTLDLSKLRLYGKGPNKRLVISYPQNANDASKATLIDEAFFPASLPGDRRLTDLLGAKNWSQRATLVAWCLHLCTMRDLGSAACSGEDFCKTELIIADLCSTYAVDTGLDWASVSRSTGQPCAKSSQLTQFLAGPGRLAAHKGTLDSGAPFSALCSEPLRAPIAKLSTLVPESDRSERARGRTPVELSVQEVAADAPGVLFRGPPPDTDGCHPRGSQSHKLHGHDPLLS